MIPLMIGRQSARGRPDFRGGNAASRIGSTIIHSSSDTSQMVSSGLTAGMGGTPELGPECSSVGQSARLEGK